MTTTDIFFKRCFDISLSFLGLALLWPIIILSILFAARDTGASGIFRQTRLGKDAVPFTVYKIRTMRKSEGPTVTTANDNRITELGSKLRRLKIDELPQLVNVLIGDMSFVGPRPDVPGFADRLANEQKLMLQIRPGITGPATLKYRDEEYLLSKQTDPEAYNRDVIWPDKVEINLAYIRNYSLMEDMKIIAQTVLGK